MSGVLSGPDPVLRRTYEIVPTLEGLTVMLEGKRCQPWIPGEMPYPEEGQGRLPRGDDSYGCQGKTRGLCSMWRLWRLARHGKESIFYLMRDAQ